MGMGLSLNIGLGLAARTQDRLAGSSVVPAVVTDTIIASNNDPANIQVVPITTNGNFDHIQIWKSVNGGAYSQITSLASAPWSYMDTAGLPSATRWDYKCRCVLSGTPTAYGPPVGAVTDFDIATLESGTIVNDSGIVLSLGLLNYGGSTVTTITMSKLRYAFDVTFLSGTTITAIALNGLSQANNIDFSTNQFLASIGFTATTINSMNLNAIGVSCTLTAAQLINVVADFSWYTGLISTATLTNLSNIGGAFSANSDTSMSTLNLPNLTNLGAYMDCNGCTNLATFSAPNLVWTESNTPMQWNGCALNVASVNAILIAANAAGVSTITIDLGGGTNAAPTGAGLTAKTALQGRGCTVITH